MVEVPPSLESSKKVFDGDLRLLSIVPKPGERSLRRGLSFMSQTLEEVG